MKREIHRSLQIYHAGRLGVALLLLSSCPRVSEKSEGREEVTAQALCNAARLVRAWAMAVPGRGLLEMC